MFSSNKDATIVPFHWTHPYSMDLREFDKKPFKDVPNYDELLKMYGQQPHAYTVLYQTEMICSFGAIKLWPGNAEVWLLTSYQFERVPISATRTAMRYFNHIAIDLRLHRLQMTVEADNLFAVRWASAVKFTNEGLMRGYGPVGQDYFMFARYFDGKSFQPQNPSATTA